MKYNGQNPIQQNVKPFSTEQINQISDDVSRDGYRLISGVLSPAEIAALKKAIDGVFADPKWRETDNVYDDITAVRLFECNRFFVICSSVSRSSVW